tara:strand:+ start:1522 stop:2019 length:498 start_codon:yes stop_codon:yes gene_type:complete
LKTLQPKQYPKNASREAKNINTEVNIITKTSKSNNIKVVILKLNTIPINWANLFGGPGNNFSLKDNLGTIIFVTKRAIGLAFGPDENLAKKPYDKKIEIYNVKSELYIVDRSNNEQIITTKNATKRAETSFIITGNEKKFFTNLLFITIYTFQKKRPLEGSFRIN